MLTRRDNPSIPVAGNANVLAGDIIQFLPWDAHLKFWSTQASAGLVLSASVGDTVVSNNIVPTVRAAGEILDDQDIVAEAVGAQGRQVIFGARNTTGAPIVLAYKVTARRLR